MAQNGARKSAAISIESGSGADGKKKGLSLGDKLGGGIGVSQFGDFDLDQFLEGSLNTIQKHDGGDGGDGGGGNILQSVTQALGLSKSAPPVKEEAAPPAEAKYDSSKSDQQILNALGPVFVPTLAGDAEISGQAAKDQDKFKLTDILSFFGL